MNASRGENRQRHLLVVDDSRLILAMVRDHFTAYGYRTDEADSAEAALEFLEGTVPDIIVADIIMPGMDGWEFYREVRRRPALATVPFVFLTAETEIPKRLRGFDMGAEDYVTKPFAVEELQARVDRILTRIEQTKRRAGSNGVLLSGSVEQLAISDLLQILALNGKDGVILLQEGEDEGRIVFEAGNIVHAACGEVTGPKALYRMLGWSSAVFRVLGPEDEVKERTVRAATTNVVMDGLVSLDEWRRWSDRLPPVEATVEVTPDAHSLLESHRVTSAELDVMGRARAGAGIRQILDQSPLPDADIAEALCALLSRGVLRTRG